jgi:predicted nuclease of predicted toxin-antitoxin system
VKFKLDENIPAELVEDLRAAGHDAATAHDEGATSASDPELLALVKAEGRIFLTLDKGVADVRAFPPHE